MQNPRCTGPLGGIKNKKPPQNHLEVENFVVIVTGCRPFKLSSIGGSSAVSSNQECVESRIVSMWSRHRLDRHVESFKEMAAHTVTACGLKTSDQL
jgi:hypothetical protein